METTFGKLEIAERINGSGGAQFGPAAPVITVTGAEQSADDEHAADFSHSGLGIGGLANYEETPVIPSVRAMERVQRMHDTDVICRRCGASKNFDGAMFTTGGNVCDDCF